jgi:enoyl-CoA hydratase/carnithine racemase
VIITGGEQFFSAGADLNEALAIKTPTAGIEYLGHWHRLNSTLEKLAKPAIAAIEGFCMTGGCEMALACDLRVAGQGASFAITSSRIGTVSGAGGTQRLPRIVGMANALELMFSAETPPRLTGSDWLIGWCLPAPPSMRLRRWSPFTKSVRY